MKRLAQVCLLMTAAPTVALAAKPTVRLKVADLMRVAKPGAGECYTVPVPRDRIANAPARLFVYAAQGAGDGVTVRVPVPADGYYRIRSRLLTGPWGVGRHGRFTMTAGGVKMPGRYQGWYGVQRKPPYRMADLDWGVAHLHRPAVELRMELSHGAHGRLLLLADLRLEPVKPAKLKPADRARKAPAASANPDKKVARQQQPWPICSIKRHRGLEWTTVVHPPTGTISVDGKLTDWPAAAKWPIAIDGTIPPGHGWASPKPASDADLSARVAVAWDKQNLYVAARVRDDDRAKKTDDKKWSSPWSHDGLVVQMNPPGWLTGSHRSVGLSPKSVSFGLNYCSPGAKPRTLPQGGRYAVKDTADGYVLEGAISFESLGWKPARAGDRFPFALILVDRDPAKPAGLKFDQYGWNYGPGSMAGMGEVRLLGAKPVAGELIAERERIAPGRPIRYVGTIDAVAPSAIQAIDVVRLADGQTVATFPVGRRLDQPGRYSLVGELPVKALETGRYGLTLRWR